MPVKKLAYSQIFSRKKLYKQRQHIPETGNAIFSVMEKHLYTFKRCCKNVKFKFIFHKPDFIIVSIIDVFECTLIKLYKFIHTWTAQLHFVIKAASPGAIS